MVGGKRRRGGLNARGLPANRKTEATPSGRRREPIPCVTKGGGRGGDSFKTPATIAASESISAKEKGGVRTESCLATVGEPQWSTRLGSEQLGGKCPQGFGGCFAGDESFVLLLKAGGKFETGGRLTVEGVFGAPETKMKLHRMTSFRCRYRGTAHSQKESIVRVVSTPASRRPLRERGKWNDSCEDETPHCQHYEPEQEIARLP